MKEELLKTQLESSNFALKTQLQIAKDFEKSQLFFSANFVSTSLSFDEITSEILVQLSELIQRGETALLQVIYQIDISEHEFLALTTKEHFLENMSEKILYREALKVYLRELL